MRYRCRNKNRHLYKHKTISLLPHQLIPYTKYSIPFIFKVLSLVNISDMSQKEVLDEIANMGKNDILSINTIYLKIFSEHAEKAVSKIIISGYYPDIISNFHRIKSQKEIIKEFVEFATDFETTILCNPIRGPSALGFDYYNRGGGYIKDADFLFGTPSQKR